MEIVGIDLGTSNSLIGYWSEQERKPVLVTNALGTTLTPSAVSIDESGEFLVGEAALERTITHPEHSASLFKRLMGSKTEKGLGNKKFRPEELSALVIRQLLQDFEAQVGYRPNEAVISVPAYFSDAQRRATKTAGELAGLTVERLVNEPTAAALAYGVQNRVDDQMVAVIDLGGGTLDVSILEYFSGVVQVRASTGDRALGGSDFDQLLFKHCLREWSLEERKMDRAAIASLLRQSQAAKCQLSVADKAEISFLHKGRGRARELQLTITRGDLEQIGRPLITRIINTMERALRDSDLNAADMDEVLLVGGATRMPLIRNLVGRLFRKIPSTHVSPDEAIANGAVTQAALKAESKALEDVVLTDVAPYTLGVEVAVEMGRGRFEEGHFLPIIERNTPVPVSRVERLNPLSKTQRFVECAIYQGESRLVEQNVLLGRLRQPLARKEDEYIEVRFTYDVNGILEVTTTLSSNQAVRRLVITGSSNDLTQDQIEAALKKLDDIKIHPREATENRTVLARAERMYEESLGERRTAIEGLIREFESHLLSQDKQLVDQKRVELQEALDLIERDPFA